MNGAITKTVGVYIYIYIYKNCLKDNINISSTFEIFQSTSTFEIFQGSSRFEKSVQILDVGLYRDYKALVH